MWVQFDSDLIEDDYVFSLAGILSISQVEAAGLIALLVICGLEKGAGDETGIVDHLKFQTIEKACYWQGERFHLIAAFQDSGVLIGEPDNDSDPLRINPHLWHSLTDRVIEQRKRWRKDKRNQREKS